MRKELRIQLAITDAEIEKCYSVIAELRPHLVQSDFVSRVRQQEKEGYNLAYLMDESDRILSVAGFRLGLNLAWGKFLYVDDLVTAESARSLGCGQAMIQWLKDFAVARDCDQFHLDSGLHRKDAHRFYEREGLKITSYHFASRLKE